MRFAAMGLSLLPLVLAEWVLRYTDNQPAESVDRDPWIDLHQLRPLFVLDRSSSRWEIPEDRMNFFRPDSFLADKPEGTRRIFVIGGSTVQGRPYAIETAFSTWLKLRLQTASPESSFEVVNCGGVSYASYRVARILEEVLQHQPDAIVIYTGHNEFLEDREYAEVRQLGPLRRKISLVASKLHVVKWIQARIARSPDDRTVLAGEVDARLDHLGGLDRYVRDADWKAGVEHHFHETLRSMIEATQTADVPLILCVPSSDVVRTPPFKVSPILDPDSPKSAEFDSCWEKASDPDLDITRRLEACARCLELDPEHAGANYLAGRIQYDRGELDLAKPLLLQARDSDVCPLRATSAIQQSVASLADEYGIPLLRTDRLLDQRDHEGRRLVDGIADPEFFVDHLHPSIAGHQKIGEALAQELDRLEWIDLSDEAEQRYQAAAEKHLDSLSEAYFATGRQRLEGLKRWASGRAAKSLWDDQPSK